MVMSITTLVSKTYHLQWSVGLQDLYLSDQWNEVKQVSILLLKPSHVTKEVHV